MVKRTASLVQIKCNNQYGDPTSEQRSTLDILEEITLDEYQSRRHNMILRNLKQAKLSQPQAQIIEIDYSPSRRLNKATIDQLMTAQFITNQGNLATQAKKH